MNCTLHLKTHVFLFKLMQSQMIMLTGVRRHSSGNDSVHTHRQGKALSNTFNTYNTFKAPRWTNRTGNGPTLIFSRTRKVLVYSTPSVAIISVWTQILEKSHSSRYVLAFCPHIAKKNNSERPVDVLAEKGESLTHLLTTWNQEMLAHLKNIFWMVKK